MAKQQYNQDYVYGAEPDWSKMLILPSIYQSELGNGLFYYGNTINSSKKKEWAINGLVSDYGYVKADLTPIPEFYLERIGIIFKMVTRGFVMQKGHMAKILDSLPDLIERFNMVETPVAKPKPKRQDVNLSSQFEIFDSTIDKILNGDGYAHDMTVLETLTNVNIKHLILHYTHELDEINAVVNKTDESLVEAYSDYPMIILHRLIKFYNDILVVLDSNLIKAVRKPRKKKVISKGKQVSKLHYLDKCDIIGISSINPRDIIGKRKVLIYNTVNKALMFFVFNNPDGALVKGSTMIGFDEKSSSSKTIRKPDVKLNEFMSVGSVKASGIYSDINAVAKPLTGRVNNNCILLKVY